MTACRHAPNKNVDVICYLCHLPCREQILSRAQELTETNTKLDVLPMIPQDQTFDMSFWSGVLQKTEEDQWEYEGAYIPDRLTVSPARYDLASFSLGMLFIVLPVLFLGPLSALE